MTQHTKNLLLAAALSLAFIGIWDHFYAFPQMDKQRAQVIEQQRESKIPKLGAPERAIEAAKPALVRTRAAALAESPRISIDTRSVTGSIALKGGRIDDISLKNYRETVDKSSPIIVLMSPEDGPDPYFADLGYLTAAIEQPPLLPTTETLWTRRQRQPDGDASGHIVVGQRPGPALQAPNFRRRRLSLHRRRERREHWRKAGFDLHLRAGDARRPPARVRAMPRCTKASSALSAKMGLRKSITTRSKRSRTASRPSKASAAGLASPTNIGAPSWRPIRRRRWKRAIRRSAAR